MYKALNLDQMCNFLEVNTIINSHDHGGTLVHTGVTTEGQGFILVNSHTETSILIIN